MYIIDYIISNGLDKLLSYFYSKYIVPLLENLSFLHTIVLVLLVLLAIAIKVLHKNNKELQKYKPKALSYQDLCIKISILLEDNCKYFRSFAPNSSVVDSDEPLRSDTSIWENVKKTKIAVNNQAIQNLITANKNLIPFEHQEIFTKMELHITVFDAHVQNPQFDYSEYTFPMEFDALIRKECFSINEKQVTSIKDWITKEIKKENIVVSELYLYGSILNNYYKDIKDVDLLLLYKVENQSDVINVANKLKHISKRFSSKFRKHMHLSGFSSLEISDYKLFKDKIDYKQEVLYG